MSNENRQVGEIEAGLTPYEKRNIEVMDRIWNVYPDACRVACDEKGRTAFILGDEGAGGKYIGEKYNGNKVFIMSKYGLAVVYNLSTYVLSLGKSELTEILDLIEPEDVIAKDKDSVSTPLFLREYGGLASVNRLSLADKMITRKLGFFLKQGQLEAKLIDESRERGEELLTTDAILAEL